mgnify:CR=1 FL=1
MGQFVDRTGRRYGQLVVIERDATVGPASGGKRVKWLCRCDCGAIRSVTGNALQRGKTQSCGCLARALASTRNSTHRLTATPTYWSWQAAKERCYNPRNHKYPSYGERGILVCDRWRNSFEAFIADMGERPVGMTLDRIDPDMHYSPDNCRWATPRQQALNRKSQRLHEWHGQRLCLKDIAMLEGIPRTTLNKRYLESASIEDAVAQTKARRRNFGYATTRYSM